MFFTVVFATASISCVCVRTLGSTKNILAMEIFSVAQNVGILFCSVLIFKFLSTWLLDGIRPGAYRKENCTGPVSQLFAVGIH